MSRIHCRPFTAHMTRGCVHNGPGGGREVMWRAQTENYAENMRKICGHFLVQKDFEFFRNKIHLLFNYNQH